MGFFGRGTLGLALLAGLASLLGASRPALAQQASDLGKMALNRYEPSPAGDLFSGVPSPMVGGHLVIHARTAFNLALKPLVIEGGDKTGLLVGTQGILHIGASLALRDVWVLSADFPAVLMQTGDSPSVEGKTLESPSGPAAGDMRLGVRVRLHGEDDSPFQAAAGMFLFLPTGSDNQFSSEGILRDAPYLTLGGRFSKFYWSASLGSMISGSKLNPSSLTYTAGLGMNFSPTLMGGVEFFGATPLPSGNQRLYEFRAFSMEPSTNAEVLLNVRFSFARLASLGAASGIGIGDGIGTPAIRSILTFAMKFDQLSTSSSIIDKKSNQIDDDEDGIGREKDACPEAHGPANADPKRNGCPVMDADEDGVWDAEDACPEKAGKAGGCP